MKRLLYSGKLCFDWAVQVGSGCWSAFCDAYLLRDSAGRLYLPGTAIAGSLRTTTTYLAPALRFAPCQALEPGSPATACSCPVCHLFGEYRPGEGDTEQDGGRASRLWVMHAWQEDGGAVRPAIRDGVGIERAHEVANRAERLKYNREVLPGKPTFGLRLELEDPNKDDCLLLATVLAEWQQGRGAIGAAAARGTGRFTLKGLAVNHRRLRDVNDLVRYLNNDDDPSLWPVCESWLKRNVRAARRRTVITAQPHAARDWLSVALELKMQGPFLVNDPAQAMMQGTDHAPLIEAGTPLLPGSSLRGVLRSQAERIARTLSMAAFTPGGAPFYTHCAACHPTARKSGTPGVLPACDAALKTPSTRSVDESHLCLACRLFGSARLGSRLWVGDAVLAGDAKAYLADSKTFKLQDFLAIDRFTGGGLDSAKFDALVLWQPRLKVRLLLHNPRNWEVAWLLQTLDDLKEHLSTFGFGGHKGFGAAEVVVSEVRYGYLGAPTHPALAPAGNAPIPDGVYDAVTLSGAEVSAVRDALWPCFYGEVLGFRRPEGSLKEQVAVRDSYWDATSHGCALSDLYPRDAVAAYRQKEAQP